MIEIILSVGCEEIGFLIGGKCESKDLIEFHDDCELALMLRLLWREEEGFRGIVFFDSFNKIS